MANKKAGLAAKNAATKMRAEKWHKPALEMVASGEYRTFSEIAAILGVQNSSLSRFLKATYAQWRQDRAELVDFHVDRLIREYESLAYFDPADLFNEDGTLKAMSEIPARVRKVIAGIEIYEEFEGRGVERKKVGEIKKIKLANRKETLDSLAKILGQFKEKVDITTDGQPINLSDEERAAKLAAILESARARRDRSSDQ